MKKLKTKMLSVIMAISLVFGIGFAPVAVSAEESARESAQTSEITTETSENQTQTDEDEEVPETEETGENKAEITLDDLLAFVGNIAEEEGLGDEWQKAVENLRLAISEKKLDVNIVLDALLLIVLVGYAIYKVIGGIVRGIASKKSTATVLSEIEMVEKSSAAQTKAVNAQTEAINALAETDTQVVESVEKENAKLNALAAAQVGTNAAIRCLIRGIGMSGAVKDEAYRALNNSDEICDKAQK